MPPIPHPVGSYALLLLGSLMLLAGLIKVVRPQFCPGSIAGIFPAVCGAPKTGEATIAAPLPETPAQEPEPEKV